MTQVIVKNILHSASQMRINFTSKLGIHHVMKIAMSGRLQGVLLLHSFSESRGNIV